MNTNRAKPICLVILGEPRTKANANSIGRGRFWRPAWVKEFEKSVKEQAAQQILSNPHRDRHRTFPAFRGPVACSYKFYFSRNPTTRDLDNCFKSVNDALQGILFVNDRDIWQIERAEKFHDKNRPRIEIEVRAIEKEG